MAWIKMDSGLRRHPKVVRISSALKADGCPDRLRVVGALHAVWSVFDEHSVDGKLHGYGLEMMDQEIGWPGFSAAMVGVGWLVEAPGGWLEMPEFSTHNGQSAKRRAQEADRKRGARETVRNVSAFTSASKADAMRTREEKRRDITPVVPTHPKFEEFWKAYPGPRKVGKAKCLRQWCDRGFEVLGDQILLHVAAMAQTPQWREANGQFIPAPFTYLNQRRFEDGFPEAPRVRLAI